MPVTKLHKRSPSENNLKNKVSPKAQDPNPKQPLTPFKQNSKSNNNINNIKNFVSEPPRMMKDGAPIVTKEQQNAKVPPLSQSMKLVNKARLKAQRSNSDRTKRNSQKSQSAIDEIIVQKAKKIPQNSFKIKDSSPKGSESSAGLILPDDFQGRAQISKSPEPTTSNPNNNNAYFLLQKNRSPRINKVRYVNESMIPTKSKSQKGYSSIKDLEDLDREIMAAQRRLTSDNSPPKHQKGASQGINAQISQSANKKNTIKLPGIVGSRHTDKGSIEPTLLSPKVQGGTPSRLIKDNTHTKSNSNLFKKNGTLVLKKDIIGGNGKNGLHLAGPNSKVFDELSSPSSINSKQNSQKARADSKSSATDSLNSMMDSLLTTTSKNPSRILSHSYDKRDLMEVVNKKLNKAVVTSKSKKPVVIDSSYSMNDVKKKAESVSPLIPVKQLRSQNTISIVSQNSELSSNIKDGSTMMNSNRSIEALPANGSSNNINGNAVKIETQESDRKPKASPPKKKLQATVVVAKARSNYAYVDDYGTEVSKFFPSLKTDEIMYMKKLDKLFDYMNSDSTRK